MFRQLFATFNPITSRSPSPDGLPVKSPFKRKSRRTAAIDSSLTQCSEPASRPRRLQSSCTRIRNAIQTPVLAFGWFYGRIESLVSCQHRASSSNAASSLSEKHTLEASSSLEPKDTPAETSNLSSLRVCAPSSVYAPSENLDDPILPQTPRSVEVLLEEEFKELTELDDGRCQYTLRGVLGEGGWSTVYLAQATPRYASSPFPPYVAIKVIPKEKCKSDPVAYTNIIREFEILTALTEAQKPCLTHLVSAFQDKHNCYAVMHVYGEDLHSRLYSIGRRMPDHEIRMYAAELLLSIENLHNINVIHRDIKPENIFLDAQGHVALGDFTIAILPDMSNGESFAEAAIAYEGPVVQGTPLRYAPEQLLAKWPCTYKMDIWAFGLILLDLYRGAPHPVFDVDKNDGWSGEVDILTRDLHADIAVWVEAIPAQDLLVKVLQRDPAKRPTIDEIKAHPYFSAYLDWNMLAKRAYQPLYAPELPLPSRNAKKYFDPEPLDTASEPVHGFEFPDATFKYLCPAETINLEGTWNPNRSVESLGDSDSDSSFSVRTERWTAVKFPSAWYKIAEEAKKPKRSASWS